MGNILKIITVSMLMEIIQEKLWENEPWSTFIYVNIFNTKIQVYIVPL